MKPLKLSMSAFGPYAGKNHKLDFENELAGKNMFLIHGKTGAGKTTILDAICFALYGDTSGNERDGKSMRSQFAKGNILTRVELEFKIKDRKYKVERIPMQERPKKRGEGTVTQKAEATLWKCNKDDEEKEELIVSGIKDVNNKIKELIGFNSEQFRQVIMIPQGQFRKLLTAKSEERQKILAEIFHTEQYKRVEKKLKDKAKALKDSITNQDKKRRIILEQIQCSEDDFLYKLIKEEYKNIKLIIEEIEKYIDKDRENLQNNLDDKKDKEKELKEARDNVTKGKLNNQKLEERNLLEKELEFMEIEKEDIKLKQYKLERARKATLLIEIEKNIEGIKKEKEQIKDDLIHKSEILENTEKQFDEISGKLKEQEDKEDERNMLDKEIINLETHIDKFEELEKVKKEVGKLYNKVKESEEEKKKNEKEIEKINKEIEKINNDIKEAKNCRTKFLELTPILKDKKHMYKKIRELNELKNKYKEIEDKYNISKRSREDLIKKYAEAKEKYEKSQKLWNEGQAGILASNLEEGTSCPVCGSIHHPQKASIANGVPTEEDIENEKLLVEKLEKEKNDFEREYEDMVFDKKVLENKIESIEKELNENKDKNEKELKEDIEKLEKEIKKLENKMENLSELQEQLKDIEIKKNDIEETYEKTKETYEKIKDEYRSNKGKENHIKESLPEEIKSLHELNNILLMKRKEIKKMKENYEKINKEFNDIKNKLTNIKAIKEEKEKGLKNIKEKYINKKCEFKKKVELKGFKSLEEYKNAKKTEDEMKILEKETEEFSKKTHILKENYKKIVEETKKIELCNVGKLEEDEKNIQIELNDILEEKGRLENKIETNIEKLKEVLEIGKNIKDKDEEYRVIGELAEVAGGQGNNKDGITFERFVLSALLDDIVIAANHRLLKMSSGRYELNRTSERERSNAQSGLELEVIDNDTGKKRHVSTLSGGEGFKASLSLALGMADVIQSYSGGIALETMFIDEGFGTLDPESLDYAIRTLIDLQQEGRMIGIISHVPELKERIDARLEITTTQRGSKAEFKVL